MCCLTLQYYINSYIVSVIVYVNRQFAFNVVIIVLLFEIFMHLKRSMCLC